MSDIAKNLADIKQEAGDCIIVAVSKTKPHEDILAAYESGHTVFGENKVQELTEKYEALPKDIEWHMLGHLQRNKVKYIAGFVALIHSVDSFKLLKEINKQGKKNNRSVPCLLQVHIADEESKFGLSYDEVAEILTSEETQALESIHIKGLMGLATNTDDSEKVRGEFKQLKAFFDSQKHHPELIENADMEILSMGMSGDYPIAIEEGSNMIRVGSKIFGARTYQN